MKVATLGPKGTFSHDSVLKVFGDKAEIIFEKTIYDVLEAVAKKEAQFGVVPIENSLGGTVGMTLDGLMKYDVSILEEEVVPVRHNLVAGGNKNGIKKIYIHPQTYAQCENYLNKNYPKAEIIETSSNGKSAEILANSGENGEAAVVPRIAVDIYNLKIVDEDIQDNKFNLTRFVILGKNNKKKTGYDRTSVAVYPQVDRPGLLYNLLGEFAKRKINLTKIESRPSKGKIGDYIFFIDFCGHKDEKLVKDALLEIEKVAFLKVLGSYPRKY